jgi:hypothetical protein
VEPGHRGVELAARVAGPAGQALDEHEPQGVDVGGRAGPVPLDLLGGQIGEAADHLPGAGQAGRAGQAGDAEVGQAGVPALVAEDVGRLHVAVHHADRMRVGQGLGHLLGHRHGPLLGQRPAGQLGGQGVPLGQVEHEVGDAAVGARAAQLDQPGVVQPGQDVDLGAEAAGVPRLHRPEHLEGDAPVRLDVPGPVHLGHPAAAQQLVHDVAAVDHVTGPGHLPCLP